VINHNWGLRPKEEGLVEYIEVRGIVRVESWLKGAGGGGTWGGCVLGLAVFVAPLQKTELLSGISKLP